MVLEKFHIKCSFERRNAESLSAQESQLQQIADAVSHPIDFELAYMHASCYQDIFGGTLKGSGRQKRFIKITNAKTKSYIYRIYKGVPSGVLSKDTLYLDSDGFHILTDADESNLDEQDSVELSIKKTNWFAYYWHTSNTMVRVTFKIGLASILLGLASLVISIFSFGTVVNLLIGCAALLGLVILAFKK